MVDCSHVPVYKDEGSRKDNDERPSAHLYPISQKHDPPLILIVMCKNNMCSGYETVNDPSDTDTGTGVEE